MQETYDPTSAGGSTLSSRRYIYLGPFQIDQQRQEITKGGERLKLQGKVYQVLLALMEKPGEVVTREELRLRLWPAETHVNYDANVNTTVNKLRLALGDSSEKPIYIETIPRKGYCLLVHPESSPSSRYLTPISTSGNAAESEIDASQTRTAGENKPKYNMMVIAAVVGLILAGMAMGMALTHVWVSHFAPVGR